MDLTADRLAAALDELDPGSRALLELSLRRGYGDVDLAKLLRTALAEVAVRRADALERVGDALELRAPGEIPELRRALEDLPAEAWTASGPAAALEPRATPAPPEPAPPQQAHRSEESEAAGPEVEAEADADIARKELDRTVKDQLGWSDRLLVREPLKVLPGQLARGERPALLATGSFNRTLCLVVATDRRLLLIGEVNKLREELPYDSLRAIRVAKKRFKRPRLELESADAQVVVEEVTENIEEIRAYVAERIPADQLLPLHREQFPAGARRALRRLADRVDLTADRLAAALDELDPGSRALLELSLRRGYGDVDLAKLLRTAPAEVAVRRADALERVGDALGLRAPGEIGELRRALGDLPAEAWAASGPAASPAPGAEPAPSPVVEAEAGAPGAARGARSRWALVGLGMLVVAAVAVLIVVLARSNETFGPTVAVRTVANLGADVRGTARLKGTGKGARLELNVSHLPDPGRDSYEVWLFDSVADAAPLGRFNGTRIRLDRELPKDPAKYRWIDISLEPPDGNPNHSGESIARVKLSALRSR